MIFDDRIFCKDCANLNRNLHCMAALPQKYTPIVKLPRRCCAFVPLKTDIDQRKAKERWPSLEEDLQNEKP